jgi:hypothetical protein
VRSSQLTPACRHFNKRPVAQRIAGLGCAFACLGAQRGCWAGVGAFPRRRNFSPADLEWTVQTRLARQLRPGCLAAFTVAPHERAHGTAHRGALPGSDAVVLVAEVRDAHTTPAAAGVTVRAASAALRDKFGLAATVVLVKPKSLPKTTSGKIQRSHTKQQFLHHALVLLHDAPASAPRLYCADVAALAALATPERRAAVQRQVTQHPHEKGKPFGRHCLCCALH